MIYNIIYYAPHLTGGNVRKFLGDLQASSEFYFSAKWEKIKPWVTELSVMLRRTSILSFKKKYINICPETF